MPTIETIYRCRIDYRWEGDTVDGQTAVEDRAFKFARKEPKVEVMSFAGGPACFPYIELESASRSPLARLAGRVERYINRRKDVSILDNAE